MQTFWKDDKNQGLKYYFQDITNPLSLIVEKKKNTHSSKADDLYLFMYSKEIGN